ncbi:MAG: csm2 [Caloramator sp.]|jgi:CRISPR-associated protein Csm2|uniref:type III-A CRISPR-associated protein Csm2 n=1 Tax=Caloramator sp. TaxID=1871330 RepID=UPI001D1B6462|nr:type III-A CRISPR-associated protein Csm2 [Caloramator sp.]MBZ4663997.1 csm2 [Caloramator sp.]
MPNNNQNKGKQQNNIPNNQENILNAQTASILLNPQKDADGKLLFEIAEKVGKRIKDDGVTVSQIRKIYSEVRKLEYDEKREYQYNLRLIKAQIGYTAGRFSKLKNFKNVFDILIQETLKGDKTELKRFKDFFEAVIAYHKAYGGN